MSLPAHAAPIRVAILPFDVHAEKDMTFLQEGILDMLGSRLAWRDNVDVINKNQTREALASTEGFDGESRALLVGGKLQADYVLFGSLTVFGESVSIDARMVDVSGQQQPVPFFAQTRGMGEVIPQINQFATTINESVFGRAAATRPITAPAPPVGVDQVAPVQSAPQVYDPRMHPEKLLQSGIQSENPVQVAGQPYQQTPNPAFVASAPAYGKTGGPNFWKSKKFKSVISAMDIGDVDNDGAIETILAVDNAILVYRVSNGRMQTVAELKDSRKGIYIGVDVADINGNGTPEIFVSSTSFQRDRFNSFVLEFNGNEFKPIVDHSPWLFRVARPGGEQPMLLAQRRRGQNDEGDLFSSPIFKMFWKGSEYAPERPIVKGRMANVLGTTFDNVMNDGKNRIIAYSPGDRLTIIENDAETAWKGSEKLGGNVANFFIPTLDSSVDTNIQYFPMRIRTADINKDGKIEVIVASNKDFAGVIQKLRLYKKSQLLSMSWNGLSLTPDWKTNEIDGRISDFAVGDFDNDGSDEIIAAIVLKEGTTVGMASQSTIIAYDLLTP
jgi:TolB-like protein